jgi:hypothetical protein
MKPIRISMKFIGTTTTLTGINTTFTQVGCNSCAVFIFFEMLSHLNLMLLLLLLLLLV